MLVSSNNCASIAAKTPLKPRAQCIEHMNEADILHLFPAQRDDAVDRVS